MAIFGGGNRMNAYGEPLVDSTLGEALGGMLGRGATAIGKGIKDRLYDDEGLIKANPEGPGGFIMGEKAGIDKPYLGEQKGIDPSTMQALGKIRFGKERGVDQSTKDFIGGLGSRLRSMFGGKPESDAFTEAGGGTYNTEMPTEESSNTYNPQEAMSMLKKGMNIQDVSQENLGSLQQLMKDEGYYEGEVDSILGPKTSNAFNSLMKDRGLLDEYQNEDSVFTTPSSRVSSYGVQG